MTCSTCAGRSGGAGSRPNYKRYYDDDECSPRSILARQVYAGLSDADRALADSKRAAEINFKGYAKQDSPLSRAATYAKTNHHSVFGDSSHESLKKTARHWFIRWCDEGRLTDVKRRRPLPIDDPEWLWLKSVLIKERYQDRVGNERRHPTLEHARQHWVATDAAAKVQRLEDIAQRRGVNLETLTARVRDKFGLTLRREKFKENRERVGAQRAALRFTGVSPLVEPYLTGKATAWKPSGEPRNIPASKIIHWRWPLNKTQAQVQGRTHDYGPLHLDQGAAHITAAVDGASVFGTGDIKYDAHMVHYDVRCCFHGVRICDWRT